VAEERRGQRGSSQVRRSQTWSCALAVPDALAVPARSRSGGGQRHGGRGEGTGDRSRAHGPPAQNIILKYNFWGQNIILNQREWISVCPSWVEYISMNIYGHLWISMETPSLVTMRHKNGFGPASSRGIHLLWSSDMFEKRKIGLSIGDRLTMGFRSR
jgi:hypothetical protein